MKKWCFLEGVWQAVLSVSETDTCQVELDGFKADLVGKIGSKEMQSGLCGWKALPSLGGAEGGVSANSCLV